MSRNGWLPVDRLMRTVHLYTGLFLVPWMVVYAMSAFCLNHHHWLLEHLAITPPHWEVLRKVDFVPDDTFPEAPEDQARAILQFLDLDGFHRIQGKPTPKAMVINRLSGRGNYRIVWSRHNALITVRRQQPFSLYRLMHFLHFRAGYAQPYLTVSLWAIIVDFVAASMLFWVISGIYLWARKPNKRRLGGVCLIAGNLLFMGLVYFLST